MAQNYDSLTRARSLQIAANPEHTAPRGAGDERNQPSRRTGDGSTGSAWRACAVASAAHAASDRLRADSFRIAVLTTSFLMNVEMNSAIPQSVKNTANTELASGIPFISDKQLEAAAKQAGASSEVTKAALDANAEARLDGLRAGLTVLILIAAVAIFFVGRIPTRQPGSEPSPI